MTTVTFAGCGDAFSRGGRFQACTHLRPEANQATRGGLVVTL